MSEVRIAVLLCLLGSTYASAQTQYVFFEIVGPNGEPTSLSGINDHGDLVGRGANPFVRDALGNFQLLSYTSGNSTYALVTTGINNGRQISGFAYESSPNPSPYSFAITGSVESGFANISPPEGSFQSQAWGINSLGTVVGIEYFSSNRETGQSFIRNASGDYSYFTCDNLSQDPYIPAIATSISDTGVIAGYYQPTYFTYTLGFTKQPGQDCVSFPYISSSEGTILSGINSKGQVSGYLNDSSFSYIYSAPSGFTVLLDSSQQPTTVNGLNSFGHVAGTSGFPYQHGFVAFPQTDAILDGILPSINFQPHPVSTTSGPISMTLHNTGSEPVGLLVDTNLPNVFHVSGTCPLVFAANAFCDLVITGTPAIVNDNRANLRIQTSAVNGTQMVPMVISGQGSNLTSSPTSYTFAVHPVGETSGPGIIYLHESGSDSVNVSSIQLAGANASDFAITSNTCQGSLPGFSTCKLIVQATPSSSGDRLAELVISSDALQSPVTIPLRVYARP